MFGKKKMRISRSARKKAAIEVVPAEPKAMTLDEIIEEESSFDVLAAADAEYNGYVYPPALSTPVEDELVELEPVEEHEEQPQTEEAIEEVTEQPEQQEVPEQPAEEVAEAPVEETAEQPAEEAVEQPAEEAVEQPAEETAEETATEGPVEEAAEESAEETVEEAAEETEEVVENGEETAEESAEEVTEEGAEEEVAEESEEEEDDSPYEKVEGSEDELSLPHLLNLPNLIEYMTTHNTSKRMKLSVGLMLASGYNKVKDNPDERKLMLKSMAITLKSLMNSK